MNQTLQEHNGVFLTAGQAHAEVAKIKKIKNKKTFCNKLSDNSRGPGLMDSDSSTSVSFSSLNALPMLLLPNWVRHIKNLIDWLIDWCIDWLLRRCLSLACTVPLTPLWAHVVLSLISDGCWSQLMGQLCVSLCHLPRKTCLWLAAQCCSSSLAALRDVQGRVGSNWYSGAVKSWCEWWGRCCLLLPGKAWAIVERLLNIIWTNASNGKRGGGQKV